MVTTPSELEGWDEIEKMAGTGNPNSDPAKAQARTAEKLTLAIVNLQQTITSHQSKTARGLERLTASIDRFNDNSGKLARTGVLLSGAIALATVAQVIIAIVKQ